MKSVIIREFVLLFYEEEFFHWTYHIKGITLLGALGFIIVEFYHRWIGYNLTAVQFVSLPFYYIVPKNVIIRKVRRIIRIQKNFKDAC